MTPILDGSDDGIFYEEPQDWFESPISSDWHIINEPLRVESRQVSLDTYQLRSPTHTVTLNKEGFDLYRDGSHQGMVVFEDWCERNNIVAIPRDDSPSPNEATDGEF